MLMNGHGCVPIKLYFREGVAGQVWAMAMAGKETCVGSGAMLGVLQDVGAGQAGWTWVGHASARVPFQTMPFH